jgi:glycosyltransferase involved in cell wall biosynthesis/GT2 family glycosyltransferase
LNAYPDIAEYKLSPFIHYIIAGKKEGRRGQPDGAIPLAYSKHAASADPQLRTISSLKQVITSPSLIAPKSSGQLSIHWVIPDFTRGGGGHMTIFRMVHLLEALGHKCTIWIVDNVFHATAADAYDDIVKYFQCVGAEVKVAEKGIIDGSGDALIATGWNTAFTVAAAQNFNAKFYFVQDHEPEFYATGAESILARRTYGLDLACICAGNWLQNLMSEKYNRWSRSFDLAYDPEIYFDDKSVVRVGDREKIKIAVYSRSFTTRRCVNMALVALELLAEERDDFEVHFFGQEQLAFNEANYQAWNHGILDSRALAALYNQCDVGICFSATNYSLVPQEMMACGLPVIELDGDSTQAIFPPDVVTLADPLPSAIKDAIAELLESPIKREQQSIRALEWVGHLRWEKSARAVEDAIYERLGASAAEVNRATTSVLDVVIPTFNGLSEVKKVIDALRDQTLYSRMKIYCVDSSSNDGTAEWLAQQGDVILHSIPQSEFQHGRTRNLGASLGTSPYIAFLTQDAIPATTYWANDMYQMMEHFPSAAGLFGRHLPYPDHPAYIQDEITNHFEGFEKYPLIVSKFTNAEKWESGDKGWRQILHFYSDNNSCMRRSIWREMPYPEVDYGEDQVWAQSIIEAGHSKIYAPSATVYHSHDFDEMETYKRASTESYFFYKHFGYELAASNEEEVRRVIDNEQKAFQNSAALYGLDAKEREMRRLVISAKHRGLYEGLMKAKATE